jgi:uncharacterized damage-inducible protein DinB
VDLLDLMLDHDCWATSHLLEASGVLNEAQLDQVFDIGHGTLRETFAHMIFNVPFWTRFLTGRADDAGYSADNQPDDRSLAALTGYHERGYQAFADAARRLRDEGRLGDAYADHYGVRKSFGGTALMVIEHNVEHRSEILHMLARLGVPDLPEIDYGVWDYRLHNS